jgi:ribosomal protein S27E
MRDKEKKITKIKVGDTLKCIDCEREFTLEKIIFDEFGEYIICPHCNNVSDLMEYYII